MGMPVPEAARTLYQAEIDRRPIPPLAEVHPGLSVQDAYQIQLAVLELKTAAGAAVVGKKTGLTSKAMQQMLGVSEPDFGHLLDAMMVKNGRTIPVSELIQPKVEPEIAFLLARDVTGPGVSPEDVLEATSGVAPALEIIDSRIRDWRIGLVDTVADNASSGRFALGEPWVSPTEFDLRLMGMVFQKNGDIVGTGAGAAVLGHPAAAVAWLANKLAEFGFGLRAKEVILPGAMCGAVGVSVGDEFTATFDRLGSVSVRFV